MVAASFLYKMSSIVELRRVAISLLQKLAGAGAMAHDEIDAIRRMQARGLRVTPQRLLVLDAVCDGKGHTALNEILLRVKEYDASIDPSTVYRTLNLLCELGL